MSEFEDDGERQSKIVEDPRDILIEIARARRYAHVYNAFRAEHGEVELRSAVASPMDGGLDWEAAQGLLNELDQRRTMIVRDLPALESAPGRPTTVTATERFEAFIRYPELATLDLKRFENIGNWSGADVLDHEVDELIAGLATLDGYEVTPIIQDLRVPETCEMHASGSLYEGQLSDGIIHLTRNTQKAHVVCPDGTVVRINKRTEFIIDLSVLDPVMARDLLDCMSRNGVGERRPQFTEHFFVGESLYFLHGNMFALYDAMIKSRHPAIEPINSTSYAFREERDREVIPYEFEPEVDALQTQPVSS